MSVYDVNGDVISGGSATTTLDNLAPVYLGTVNAMLKCAYTYIDACRNGDLVYGDGTGSHQVAGTISCSTFMRCVLQGIPYNDYRSANASSTSKSGKRFRYGYRMVTDYYATSATATAQEMYNQFREDGRAFPIDYNFVGAMPGDLICFGTSTSAIRHIGMYVYRDSEGNDYIMDSNISSRNGNLAIRIHKAYNHSAEASNNPVGIIRPNLSDVSVHTDNISVTASNGNITGSVLNGYGQFLRISCDVTGGTPVTYGDISFTPNNTGKDYRVIPVLSTTEDTTSVLSYSGISNVECEMSHYL